MYSEKIILTNKRRVPLSLTSRFRESFLMCDEIGECSGPDELCEIVNLYESHGYKWKVEADNDSETRLSTVDAIGNDYILIVKKVQGSKDSRFSGIPTSDLIMELLERGFQVSKIQPGV